MCGICGELTFTGQPADVGAIAAMNETLAPRGPDGSGVVARGRVALGHRRLKILDLSERAEQPMVDPALGLAIAFNGCIYNFRELRADLEAKGYSFFSGGDTEIILKAYHAWGPSCVERFHGMFAFAIHERETGRVVLARDRFGIKPLYIARTNDRLRFASTLPALVAAGGVDTGVDPVALHHYMSFHAVVPAPRTILKGVAKLPPATVRVIEPDGRETDTVYWRLDFSRGAREEAMSDVDWQDRVLAALRKAVERRLVADVPVGVLLSGGVDSSVIVALLAEAGQSGLKTFSVGFESVNGMEGDEFVYSDIVAKRFGTDHTRIFVPSNEMLAALPGVITAQSEPMVSYDNVGFYLLSQEVAKHVTVVQSGQGADEVFAGYHWYPPLSGANDPVGDYARVFFDRTHDRLLEQLNPDYWTPADESRAFVEAHMAMAGADDPVDKALRLDSTVMLVDDPVKRVDNMTMAFGLEARVPFLDHELVELAAKIPPRHKVEGGGKKVLKDVARKLLPAEIIDRKKGYFPVPALKYVEGPVLEMVRDTLTSRAARDRGLFRQDYIDGLLGDPKAAITPLGGSELWQAATLELWLQAQAA
ncbi:N-acetylglutaminylglutamine amidotransferase [Methylobrevis albus]|uniref:asparagine synthase (glutamine-hydrolyzing) n=1 Tax=Methylobrevis albus TaxID=2793297 RepID=A0A931HZ96_9HYPH|nr:N-acetylglutaminylglutamine amidotransferase [Methylobrevis albus]MBH0236429.1 N-acetylglutaminylglutamine amidotransferase [Methylobrevis albus]